MSGTPERNSARQPATGNVLKAALFMILEALLPW